MKKIFVKFAVVAVLVAPLAAALPAGAATPNWDITGTWDLSFVANVGAIGTYNHHMDVTQAPDGDFTGTGYYVPAPSFTWVIDPGSTVSGDSVHILLHYTAGHPDTWTTTADATIDGSGTSLSGTWLDSEGDSGTWTGEGTATAVLLSVTTNPATGVTPTSATLNGTNGTSAADDTSFWTGTTSGGPFTPSADPASELPGGWSGVDSLAQSANALFSYTYTGLTPSTQYYFVAWSLVGGIWYPGEVLNFTTTNTGTLVVEKHTIGGNGTFTLSGDNGIGSFQITTTGNSQSGSGSQTFNNLAPGTYSITETAKSGWTQTDNSCSQLVLTAGENALCVVINTNNKKLGSIRGIKYEDRDGDGTLKDGDHHRLAGWTIYLDTNNNGALDSGEPTTVTNSHGLYFFAGLIAGTYHVREVGQSGWTQTYPVGGKYDITLTTGQNAKNKNFGNFKLGTISGMKFNDLNGNGRKDKSETGLAGWTINLTGPNGFSTSTVTGADGSYSFTGLKAGVYKLSEVMQTGWTQTAHPGPVRIQSGTVSAKDNFGNTQKKIHGWDNKPWPWPWQQFGNDNDGHDKPGGR